MRPVGIIILALVIAISGFFVWDAWRNSGPRIPREAKILINPDVEEAKVVLPHTIDDRTYFEESLDYLAEGAPAPKIVQVIRADRPARVPVPTVVPKNVNDQPYQIFRNWTGAVLVPDLKVVSKAYTDLVTLARVEAHPIEDGRIRVWARVQNLTDEPLLLQQDCTFRMVGSTGLEKPFFESLEIPAADFRDVMFESDTKGVVAYTILVRLYQEDIW
ncbi:MAG: hypothetical protein DRP71_04780 [Verrucomicrobia bacterium]|nr:MAG: hypothetical protein DRP71_04780 [Verrucomicrobiota bacterium]